MTTDFDDEIAAFIQQSERFYPDSSTKQSVATQRANYDALCRAFSPPHPDGVTAADATVEGRNGRIPVRHYRPGTARQARILYLHGGGFILGGLDSHDSICAEICAGTGLPLTAVDYRLAPEHRYPAHFHDALDAFVETHSGPTVIMGDSAGGTLAAAVCIALRDDPRAPVGQVLIYPALGGEILDLPSHRLNATTPLLNAADIDYYDTIRSDGPPPHDEPTYFPLALDDYAGLPPCVAVSADADPLRDDSRAWVERLNAAGVSATWRNEPGLVHGYLRARHMSARARTSFQAICDAARQLGEPS